jgi:tRNA-2-methylthio-N6-dimethylallyladenosine synthase
MKYFIKTFGCQMNVHESEKLAGVLSSINYSLTDNVKDADVIIFNTCCIRDGVEQKIYGNISITKNLKKKNPNLVVAICGCMSQASGRAEILKKKYPYVNIVFGTHNLHEFKDYLLEYQQSRKNQYKVWEKEQGIFEDVDMYRTSGNNAWVNISYGCNNFCTYCIVPYVRGRERSKSMSDIINEVSALAKEGYKYITLLGQNVNSYGNDLNDENVTFANLLRELCMRKNR